MIRGNRPERNGTNPVANGSSNIEVTPPQSEVATHQPLAAEPAAVQAQTVATIGPKIRFKGELIGEEDLLVQGYVDGTIDLKGNNLTIGEQGEVKANVLAQTVIIEGTIEGDIFGEERITIRSSSNVKGNLVAERVTLEDGAKFKGSIDMEMDNRKQDCANFNSNSTLSPKATSSSAPSPVASKAKDTE